jgi:hypothetical protein
MQVNMVPLHIQIKGLLSFLSDEKIYSYKPKKNFYLSGELESGNFPYNWIK